MEMIGKVRRMKLREQLSNSEIAKRTGLSRNTVKKWLKAPGDQAPKYKRQSGFTKLSAFEGVLVQALKADSHRPKHARRSARALLAQLQAQGYRGGYSRLTDFIRAWREQEGQAASKAYVPLSFELGEAFQFDWSEEGLLIGGVYHHMQVSHLKLCASRAFWVVAYPSQGHEMLFDAHTRSFAALGGVARRGIYDNMKTAVDLGFERQRSHRQCPLQCAVQPLPVCAGLLQRGLGLGERGGGEERAGQPQAYLDRGWHQAVWLFCGAQCLVG